MQHEIDAEQPQTPVRLLGVNAAGQESGNAAACAGRTLPWLQDTFAADVWGKWRVTWRDVVILDSANRPIHVYNLTVHNLANPADYSELKSILLAMVR